MEMLMTTKVLVLFLLCLIKVIFGLLPLFFIRLLIKRKDKSLKKFIGLVLCFGGGVLISTVFMHMLNEVRESLERAARLGALPKQLEKYPFAELLLCLGFLTILVIESAVHKVFGGSKEHHGHSHCTPISNPATSTGGEDNPGFLERDPSAITSSSDSDSENASTSRRKSLLSSLRSFLVFLALSVHSLFEGMAIGLEENESGVWKLFMAVAIHSSAIIFCIGTEMTTTGIRKRSAVIYILVLSVVTPVGVLIGILVTAHLEQASGAQVLAIGVLQGLAAGTLLYITFYEVLSGDKLSAYGMSGVLGALAVILGFALMAGMEAGTGGHSHGEVGHAGHSGHEHGPVGWWEGQGRAEELRGHFGGEHEGHEHEDHHGQDDVDEHDHKDHHEHEDEEEHTHKDHDYDHSDHNGQHGDQDHDAHEHDDHVEHDHEDHDSHEHEDQDEHDHEDHDAHGHEDHDEHDPEDLETHEHEDHNEHDHEGHDAHGHEDHDEHDHDNHDAHEPEGHDPEEKR